jgi:hypothetical protein
MSETQTQADEVVDDILSQLKNSAKECTELTKPKDDDPKVTKENLEEFVIKKSAALVEKALDIVDEIKDRATASDDAEEVRALADMLKATSSAVDALNKVHIASERNQTAKEINQKNIDARQGMNTQNNQTKLLLSREEVMKQLFGSVKEENEKKNANKPPTIDVEVEEVKNVEG